MHMVCLIDHLCNVLAAGTNDRRSGSGPPIDLKRKSSENLPVDSKQLKTTEPASPAAVLEELSRDFASFENEAEQQQDWQVIVH